MCANSGRAKASVPPPAGNGTTIVTGLVGQGVTGGGIRPAPYSTDFAQNNYTYTATNNTAAIAVPHGIGFVWCTILWEMTWELINTYGYDPNIYNGTGGTLRTPALFILVTAKTGARP